jgi:hypothetical protein
MKPKVKQTTAILTYRLAGNDKLIQHEYSPKQRKQLYVAQAEIHQHKIDYMVVSFRDIESK